MKRHQVLLVFTIVLTFGAVLFTILDFLCLHDIRKDYVSRWVFEYLNIDVPSGLPDWTETPGEWWGVTLGYLFRVFFLIFNMITLLVCYRKFKKAE